METKGIRIADKINNIVSVELPDILQEISNGQFFYWSILFSYGTGKLSEGQSLQDWEKQIKEATDGLLVTWEELNALSHKFWDLYDITIIASKDRSIIKRYSNDREMYEKCDIVIEMIDSGYWEVFSKDSELINKLEKKFKATEPLEPDFEK